MSEQEGWTSGGWPPSGLDAALREMTARRRTYNPKPDEGEELTALRAENARLRDELVVRGRDLTACAKENRRLRAALRGNGTLESHSPDSVMAALRGDEAPDGGG